MRLYKPWRDSNETHSWTVHCCKSLVLIHLTRGRAEVGWTSTMHAGCSGKGNGWHREKEKYVWASSLTALLHPGHKASQRYLWSQLGHGGRRRSDRHWKPAERREKVTETQKKEEESPSVTKNIQKTTESAPRSKANATRTHKRHCESCELVQSEVQQWQSWWQRFIKFINNNILETTWPTIEATINRLIYSKASPQIKRCEVEKFGDVCECDEISHVGITEAENRG